ncbi:MAG TPA: hypothetical protein VN157_05245 [Caulobacter sp.]|nr:hypothetical protein [Caulobacter sp.]
MQMVARTPAPLRRANNGEDFKARRCCLPHGPASHTGQTLAVDGGVTAI